MERTKHTIDATNQVLGRLATKVAVLLRGKNKIGFTLNEDRGDEVLIRNPHKIRVTGRKLVQKQYYRHSGYPGGLRQIALGELLEKNPNQVISKAVRTMLPNNRLRRLWMQRLTFEKDA